MLKRLALWIVGLLVGLPLAILLATFLVRGVLGGLDRWQHGDRAADAVMEDHQPVTYHVRPGGDDAADGLTPETAFQTLAPVRQLDLGPGDRVLLEGGSRFDGPLQLDEGDVGTPRRPIVIASFGTGRATVDGGAGDAVVILNTGGVEVRDLNVVGDGSDDNRGDGVRFENQLLGATRLAHVRVDRVTASGFGGYGVRVESGSPSRIGIGLDFLLPPKSGYRDVEITRVAAHDNGLAGIYVYGEFNPLWGGTYAHRDVTVRYCKAYRNIGRSGPKLQHTGSGIVVSDVDGAVIEHSVAYENGLRSESKQGGPVGIWAWDATRVAIRRNVAYRNRTDGKHDGGGFDLDGGITHSVMEYNLSYGNDGSGFLLAQFPNAHPFHDNVVRYNVSVGDARKNKTAGILFWSGDPESPVIRTEVVHNTIIQTPSPTGNPSGIYLREASVDGLTVRDNVFATLGPTPLVMHKPGQRGLDIRDNIWATDTLVAEWDGAPVDAEALLGALGARELLSLDALGLSGPLGADSLAAYVPLAGSPVLDAASSTRARRDIRGTPVPQGAAPDIGAIERTDEAP